jgi:hypothetical protein
VCFQRLDAPLDHGPKDLDSSKARRDLAAKNLEGLFYLADSILQASPTPGLPTHRRSTSKGKKRSRGIIMDVEPVGVPTQV